MTLTLRKTLVVLASALSVAGYAATANAFYLGYANGDATNESFWQEQGAEPITSPPRHVAQAPRPHHKHHLARHHSRKNTSANG